MQFWGQVGARPANSDHWSFWLKIERGGMKVKDVMRGVSASMR